MRLAPIDSRSPTLSVYSRRSTHAFRTLGFISRHLRPHWTLVLFDFRAYPSHSDTILHRHSTPPPTLLSSLPFPPPFLLTPIRHPLCTHVRTLAPSDRSHTPAFQVYHLKWFWSRLASSRHPLTSPCMRPYHDSGRAQHRCAKFQPFGTHLEALAKSGQ